VSFGQKQVAEGTGSSVKGGTVARLGGGYNLELQLVELGDTFVGALDSRGHCLLFR